MLGGGEVVVINLLKHLDRSSFDPCILSFREGRSVEPPMIIKVAEGLGFNTHMISVRGRFDPNSVSALERFIKNEGVDILHCHGYKSDITASLLRKESRPKIVTTLHGWWMGNNLKLKLYDWLDMKTIRGFERVIAVASHIRDELVKKGFPPQKVVFIPNGVEVGKADSESNKGIREELGIPADTAVIGIVGRLEKEKGHEFLMRSIVNLPRVVLMIVGSGPLEKELVELSERLGIRQRTIFTGFRSNVKDYISALDIFVLPSLSEGLPLALLEAMAAGKPVVASNVGGVPTIIDGKDRGLLVEPRDVAGLESAIFELVGNTGFTDSIAENGRRFVEQNYSLSVTTRKYEELYKSILKGA